MEQTVMQMREAAKALPENDPHRKLLEQTATTLEERAEKDTEEKHGDAPLLVEQFVWIGGSVTFAEADDYHDGREIDMSIEEEKNTFDLLHRNIWSSDRSVTEKARLTEQAARDLARRIGDVDVGERSTNIVERVRSFMFGEKRNKVRTDDQKSSHLSKAKDYAELSVFKDANGDWRWFAAHSNNYFDRDDEVFPATAHRDFEGWVDATGNYPELRLWHVPGTRIGLADLVAYDESSGFMVSSGTFDPEMEDVAERLAEDDDLACSHGFEYREDDLNEEGVYARYRSFEVTVLPAAHAANPWTAITVGQIAKEVQKGMQDQKRAFLVEKMGEERTARIEAQLAALGKELDESGIGWKDVLEGNGSGEAVAKTEPSAGVLVEDQPAAAAAGEEATAGTAGEEEEDKKPEGDATPADAGKGSDVTSELVAVLNTAIREQLAPITASIAELQSSVKALQVDDDSKIAATMRPRVTAAVVAEQRPTDKDGNLLSEEDAKKATGGDKTEEQPINPYVEMALNGGKVVNQG